MSNEQTDRYRTVAVPLGPPKPELSRPRVALLLLVLAGVSVGAWQFFTRGTPAADAKSSAAPVYAPYVDVTQTPTYPFQLPSANPVSSVYLAFVVGDRAHPCEPSWGGYYTLDQAEQTLDLDARTAQLRKEGGSVMISFGGRDNTELAVGCTDAGKLLDAYRAPLERYQATTIDLDLEGAALGDQAANARRAAAIAALQREFSARHTPLPRLADAARLARRPACDGIRGRAIDARGKGQARGRQRDGHGLRLGRERAGRE